MYTFTSAIALAAVLSLINSVQCRPPYGKGRVEVHELPSRKQCTVYAHGGNTSDVPNILHAFTTCDHGGTVIFPASENYFIASKLNPVLHDVTIDWQGTWTFSPDIEYWRQPANHYPIAFQNHAASFAISGDGIRIDGHGIGGIQGNGDVWYTAEAGVTQPGRPMPFVFWNVSDVVVEGFRVIDPPLWSLNIMNGTDMYFNDIYCNATATKAPYGSNWVQNTDGFDTMDANNIHLTNFIYQGGDDCVAIKPRSTNIYISNATCRGGNGMAIGSLGQYPEDSSVTNVVIDDVKILRYNEDMHNSAYIKTWIGVPTVQNDSYESGTAPRGGGWGVVRNVVFSNFEVEGAEAGPGISEDSGDDKSGTYKGTSLMEVSNIAFVNFTGYLNSKTTTSSFSCSSVHPCFNIELENVALTTAENSTSLGTSKCSYVEEGGVHGVNGTGC